jgi:uncharacterized membrane protein
MNEEAFGRLERQLGRLLHVGLTSAAICLILGLALSIGGIRPNVSNTILTAGLVILMLTPLARVVTSLFVYVRMRDWLFVATTVLVFVVLLLAWLLKAR